MTPNPNRKSEEEIMKKAISIRLAIAVVAFCLPLIPSSASAQQEKSKESVATEQKPVAAYRIELNVREIEDGKRLNSRNYMMTAEDATPARIRVGNRVATPSPISEQFEYHEVGMSIDCTPHARGDSVMLVIHVEFTSLPPEAEAAPKLPPVVRTERTEVAPTVTYGKPTLVASMDDTLGNRRYEVEVTATKVK
jgi:hypothetical protein